MGRIRANDGQELLYGDLNKIGPLVERELYDRVLYEMLQRTVDGFFAGGFLVTRTNSTTLSVAAGLGIQSDGAQVSPEPTKRPLYRSAAVAASISTPHATLNRIDIISVKAARATTLSESRRYKATEDAAPVSTSFVVEDDWQADVVVTAGTASGSPVAPATPAGYIKIAEIVVTAVTGIAASGAITDKRTILGYGENTQIDTSAFTGVTTKAAGTKLKTVLSELDGLTAKFAPYYDAVVGSIAGCTHSTLAAAIAAASPGWRILIVSDLTVNTTISVNVANLQIESKPGVSFTNGTAGTCLTLAASGIKLLNNRFSGFTTAISITDTFKNHVIMGNRYATCTNLVTDNNTTPNLVDLGNLEE